MEKQSLFISYCWKDGNTYADELETQLKDAKEFTMVNTEKTAVEIEWILDVPVREDIYEYIVNS